MSLSHYRKIAAATACWSGLFATVWLSVGAQPQQSSDGAVVRQGEYIARAGDCIACHTVSGGKAYAGGLPFKTPIGTVYSTNITPDLKTGIGSWSRDDFRRLMRSGVKKDGTTVYPAMPFPSYAHVADADLDALYAYLQHGVEPVDAPDQKNGIPFPLSMRWPLAIWRGMFGPGSRAAPAQPPATAGTGSATVARGAYLVEGLGHCGACHTPRGLALEEKALTSAGGRDYLAGGGAIDGWIPPSLRSDPGTGLDAWSEDEIFSFLKTGRNDHSATFGAMNDVVVDSMQYMTDADLHSIAAYLKTLSTSVGVGRPFSYDDTTAVALRAGDVNARGAQIYVDRCAACHRTDGAGYKGVFPALAGNPVLQGIDATSTMHIVLSGGRLPATMTAPSSFVMGPYATVLDDQAIADVVSFIETSWGNRGSPVSAADVTKVRILATPVAAANYP